MGDRKSYEYLNKLKKKLNTDTLWSWSRYNSYHNDEYGYLLKYIKHIPETQKDSIWGISGGSVHDILERYYIGEIKYEDMLQEYEEKLFEMNSMELKYNKINKDMNDKISDKYEDSIRHFLIHYKPIEAKVITEQFVTIKVKEYYFQGYIDFIFKDIEGNYIIEDFKTSTMYSGIKRQNESKQLLLYSQSLIQKGVPIDKIKLRWNFLKYCTVVSCLMSKEKDGSYKTKEKNCVRSQWVKESAKNIEKWLKKEEYDELEIVDIIETCIENNNLEILPQHIQDKFSIKDCYVYIDLNEDSVNTLNDEIVETLKVIIDNTRTTNILLSQLEGLDVIKDKDKVSAINTKIDEMWWTDIDRSKEYFFFNLSGYSRKQHKPWNEYLNDINSFAKDITEDKKDDSLDWLNEL